MMSTISKELGVIRRMTIVVIMSLVAILGLSAQSLTGVTKLRAVTKPSTSFSIEQYGIKWTFDKEYATGSFANGDRWVVGPVKIVDIYPRSRVLANGRVVNGSMLNPAPSWYQGYDSGLDGSSASSPTYPLAGAGYKDSLNAGRPNGKEIGESNPLVIDSPASLVSGVSYVDDPAHPIAESNQVHLMAVLTVLGSVPPDQAFRPPFTGTDKTIKHTASELRYGKLTSLARPGSVTSVPDIDTLSAKFQKLWPDHEMGDSKEERLPKDNMPAYGREVAALISEGALMLTLAGDSSKKNLLALRMVQIGLDISALVRQPAAAGESLGGSFLYLANGGHCSGRGFLVTLAGFLLEDDSILGIMRKSGQYAYQNGYTEGNLPPDYIHFGETDQTFYVTQRDVDRTNGASWNPYTAGGYYPTASYASADVGLADWGIEHAADPWNDNKAWGSAYRAVNSVAWSGLVLASRILGMKDLYNHPALFDYMDRWMSIQTSSRSYTPFQETMWDAFRASY